MIKHLLGLLMVVALLTACKKDTFRSDFAESRDAWQDFKKVSGNTYSYTATSSSWVGSGSGTKITVTNGIVTGRDYNSYSVDGQTGQKTPRESWTEDLATLNSHTAGAAAITLDAVYEKAATVWLKANVKNNTVYFEANNHGMISTCGYVPNGCADDCFTGITITEILPI